MASVRDRLSVAWVAITALAGIALPYVWWPYPFSGWMILHAAIFSFAAVFVAFGCRRGGWFDSRTSRRRGFSGVIAYSTVIIGSTLAYRLLFL